MINLPKHFFVSESDGHLHDTRRENWPSNPLRWNYAKVTATNGTIGIRATIRAKYAFPGGYELIFVTDDGAFLCMDCAKENYKEISYSVKNGILDGWNVWGIVTNETIEESETCCSHCDKELSPYID